MSIGAVLDRIAQLAPAPPAPTPAAAAPASSSFAATLQTALSAGPATGTVAADVPYAQLIDAAGARYGVDPRLIQAVIEHESRFQPDVTSSAGAAGLMQLMPATARALGVANPYDPAQSIDGGTRYLADALERYGGDVSLALASYSAGPGAVARFGGVPPYEETQGYVQWVTARYAELAGTGSGE